jgi:hypothetical protein
MKIKEIKVGEAYAVGSSRNDGQKRAVVLAVDVEKPVVHLGRATGRTEKGYVRVELDTPSYPGADRVTLVRPRDVQVPWAEHEAEKEREREALRTRLERQDALSARARALAASLTAAGFGAWVSSPSRGVLRIAFDVDTAERLVKRLSGATPEGGSTDVRD